MALTLLDHADALSAINVDQDNAVARDVGALATKYSGRSDLAHAAHTMLPDIIDMHANIAGHLTANWYDGLDPSSAFKAKPYTDIPAEQVSKMIDWALHAPGEEPPESRLIGSSQRLVRGVSRQTVTQNAAKEGVRYARYAHADACAFCRALSIRGSGREDQKYLYDTEKAAEFRKSDGEKYHTHCNCVPVAIRKGQVWTPPDYAAEWEKQYSAARRKTKSGDKLFARIVEQMRQDEPKPQVEAGDQGEGEKPSGATIHEFPTPTPGPEHEAAKSALDAAQDWDAISQAAKDLLPDTRVQISHEALLRQSDHGSPGLWDDKAPAVMENVKQMVHAADDILTKYPGLELESLKDSTDFNSGNPYATTALTPGRTAQHQVKFNRSWLVNPGTLEDSWARGVATGFHYAGTDNPVYDIMIHEMGHVMQRNAEDRGVAITDGDIGRALVAYYLENVHDDSGVGTEYRGYQRWLHDNLSGYSTHTLPPAHAPDALVGPINGREALAEAFADVEVNGDDAHETSQVLHGLLVAAYNEAIQQGADDGLSTAV